MQVLNDYVIVKKQKDEYQGLIQGVESDDATKAKVLGFGGWVEDLKLEDTIMIDWNEAKKIKNDLYVIKSEHIIAIYGEDD
jgi:hypothetical protein